jgi:hypothetical protein
MEHIAFASIESLIDEQLIKLGKDFATIKQILEHRKIYSTLGLTANMSQNDILAKLKPHLGQAFRLHQASRRNYLVRNQSNTELVLNSVNKQTHPKTIAQWSQFLPLTKTALIEIVNNLISTQQISVNFNAALTARLIPVAVKTVPILPPTPVINIEDDSIAFRAAYDAVRGNKDTVRIHKIRELLGWTVERFNTTLEKLRADYKIDVNLGNPSYLTSKEIENSYVDPLGTLYVSLSWR